MLSKFNVAYIIDNNDEQLNLLCMSLNTLLKFNKVDNIYIVYYNLDKDYLVEVINNSVIYDLPNIEYYYFDMSIVDKDFPDLPNTCNGRLRYPSLTRFYISKIIPHDKYWYLDTDLIFNSEVRNYFLSKQKYKLFYCFNRKKYKKKIITYEHTESPNAGILFINAKKFNKLNLFDDIKEFYKKNADTIKYMNQSGYEFIMNKHKRICNIEVSDEYNIRPTYEHSDVNIKVFHCNGAEKNYFYIYYKQII